ncbi:hypothetical protein ACFE04_007060 [Oxalis oulophora]
MAYIPKKLTKKTSSSSYLFGRDQYCLGQSATKKPLIKNINRIIVNDVSHWKPKPNKTFPPPFYNYVKNTKFLSANANMDTYLPPNPDKSTIMINDQGVLRLFEVSKEDLEFDKVMRNLKGITLDEDLRDME